MSKELVLKDRSKTVLEQIFENKIPHKHSCLSGLCGACRCKKPIDGKTKYVTDPMYPILPDEFLPCISLIDSEHIKINLSK